MFWGFGADVLRFSGSEFATGNGSKGKTLHFQNLTAYGTFSYARDMAMHALVSPLFGKKYLKNNGIH